MSVKSHHPDYDTRIKDWEMLRDVASGETQVKLRGTVYLPMPSGFAAQSDGGTDMYTAYALRAQFPDIFTPTLSGMVGVIHRTEAQIEGLEENKPLAPLWEKATKDGLPLETFHRQITAELLQMGRYVALTDVASDGDAQALPYLVGYDTEHLINWSPDRDLFVLDETKKELVAEDGFEWADKGKYRVLRLVNGVYTAQLYDEQAPEQVVYQPNVRGGQPLKEIPLVIATPRDLSLLIFEPPLIGVARSCLAIYRLDADYRHQLFGTGQETLFIQGITNREDLPKGVGSGVVFGLPQDCDAKYVGPTGVGINAHRQAIMDERQAAVSAGVRMFDAESGQAESGEALRLRAAAQTATLTSVALASAALLEKALRYAAQFVGQNPDEIIVKPNLKFIDTVMTPADAAALVTVWQGGAISKQTLYENLQRGEIASAERTFEEEQELIDEEAIDQPVAVGPVAPDQQQAEQEPSPLQDEAV
jgi:Domain of unknown function (DUF4055)